MKKLLFSALMGAMIISCSRDNDNVNPTIPQTPAISQTVILPTKLTLSQTGKADEVTTFSYNGNKLVKYTYDNKDQTYTYIGDFITSVRSEDDYTEFNYDSNGNLISESYTYNHEGTSIKARETHITYTVNNSTTITAQKTSKKYDNLSGSLVSTTTSTITYTLDAKKRPIKGVEVSEEKDTAGNVTQKDNNTFTYQYANHHSFSENIKGMDKLTYSSFEIGEKGRESILFSSISYTKKEINETIYRFGGPYYINSTIESKVEYTLNTNNYPTKIIYKTPDHITGQYKNRVSITIEYNR